MYATDTHASTQRREAALVGARGQDQGPTSHQDPKEASSEDDGDEDENQPNGPGLPRGPAGYAYLAEFMTKTQHSMIRRYKELSLMNLLYLQAEIQQLKANLDKETAADAMDKESVERRYWDYQ